MQYYACNLILSVDCSSWEHASPAACRPRARGPVLARARVLLALAVHRGARCRGLLGVKITFSIPHEDSPIQEETSEKYRGFPIYTNTIMLGVIYRVL